MAYIKKRSALPLYAAAGIWVLWALFLPLYSWLHFGLLTLISAGVYLFTSRVVWKDKRVYIPDPPPAPAAMSEEEQAIAALKAEGARALSEMRRLDENIADPHISAQIVQLQETCEKILHHVAQNPDKMGQIRRFMNYYLPTTLKLLNAYDRMDAAGVSGVNIDGTKGRIESMMDTVVSAFDRQLDALFGSEAMDVSSEITVLEQMLAREGLGGTQLPTMNE